MARGQSNFHSYYDVHLWEGHNFTVMLFLDHHCFNLNTDGVRGPEVLNKTKKKSTTNGKTKVNLPLTLIVGN